MTDPRAVVRASFLVLGLFLSACGSHVAGEIWGHAGPTGDWRLVPDTCFSGAHRGFFGADIYRRDLHDDTELVVMNEGNEGPTVLVRLPGQRRMVRLSAKDCRVFEPAYAPNGAYVNGVPGLSGSMRLDCTAPEVGHVEGSVAFDCY